MPFSVDKYPDLPAIQFVQSGDQVAAESADALAILTSALDGQAEPVFLIMDVRALSISLDDLTGTASLAALRPDALLHHRNVRETLIISKDGLIKLAAQGLRTATFGNVHLKVFGMPDQALDYCREQLAIKAGTDEANSQTG